MERLTMDKKDRIEWVAVSRGIAIILVVYGHVVVNKNDLFSDIHDVIYIFHMPLFFFLSGFLYGVREVGENRKETAKKKLISLGIPYLFFASLYILMKVVLQKYIHVEAEISLDALYKLFYDPSHIVYWFLYDLLLYFMIACIVDYGNNKKTGIIILVICFATYIIYYQLNIDNSKWLTWVSNGLFFYGGIEIGVRYDQVKIMVNRRLKGNWYYWVLIICAGIGFTYLLYTVAEGSYVYSFIRLLACIFLVSSVIILSSLCARITLLLKMFNWLAKISWYVYLLHPYFMNVSRGLLGKYVTNNVIIQIIIQVLSGIIGAAIVGLISEKIWFLSFMFYPYKFLNKKRERKKQKIQNNKEA